MLIEAFGFGCAYWFLDALLCYFYNGSTNFIKELFQPDPLAFYRRVMVLSVLVLFVSHILSKFRQLEGKLQEYTVFNQTLLRNTNNPSEKSGGMSPDVLVEPDAQKVFFYIPQLVGFSCQNCAEEKSVQVKTSVLQSGHLAVSGQCWCGQQFDLLPEKRRMKRYEVAFPGIYQQRDLSGKRVKSEMLVSNISRFGLQMKVPDAHGLEPGDIVDVSIQLGEEAPTSIKKTAVIKTVDSGAIGSKFLSALSLSSPLAAYLK